MKKVRLYFKLMRTHQYVKNVLVFAPVFFGVKIFDIDLILASLYTFLAFSFIASSIYIFNDYCDIEEDRKHPKKKNRPLAAGDVSIRESFFLMGGLFTLSLAIIYFCTEISVLFILLFYFVMNLAYSTYLKHIALVDVFVIALGFILRILSGSLATSIQLSIWLILLTFLLALFLALAKRRNEVWLFSEGGEKTRAVIDGYNLVFLDISMGIMASITIVAYIMYSVSPDVTQRVGSQNLYLSVFFVIFGILRYLQITFVENNSGSPTEIVLKDRLTQLSIFGWIITLFLIFYYQV